jgi:hypothetical protein
MIEMLTLMSDKIRISTDQELRKVRSVAILGETIVVGAPFEDSNAPDSGAAYVFTSSGGT